MRLKSGGYGTPTPKSGGVRVPPVPSENYAYVKRNCIFFVVLSAAGSEKDLQQKEAKLMELQEFYETQLLKHKVSLLSSLYTASLWPRSTPVVAAVTDTELSRGRERPVPVDYVYQMFICVGWQVKLCDPQ